MMQILSVGEAYRTFAYANVLAVLIGVFYQFKASNSLANFQWVKYLILFTFGFFVIHFIAVQNLVFIKEMRHILIAAFLVVGIYMLDSEKESYVRRNIFNLVLVIIFTYVASQIISLWLFNRPYGTAKNPHYLALFSSASIIVALYCFLKASTIKLKSFIGGCILLLGGLLIHSLSRPAWIGLILAGLLITFFLTRKQQLYTVSTIVLILLVLMVTNVGSFADRSNDLIENVRTEERVTIWQDTWRMQTDSTVSQWVVGHGLRSFEESFKSYSAYHKKGIDFNSPHNYVLELLFISGVLGLSLALILFWLLYKGLIKALKLKDEDEGIYVMLIAILTSSIILTSITLPFFSSNSMNIIAVVVGVMLYLRKSSQLSYG
jgi:O-antigen ligase